MQVHHLGSRIRGFYRIAQLGHRWVMTPNDAQHRLTILPFLARHGQVATCEAFGVSRCTLYRWKQTFTQAGGNPTALPIPPTAANRSRLKGSPAIPWCGCKPGSAATSSPSAIPPLASLSPLAATTVSSRQATHALNALCHLLPEPPRFLLSNNGSEFLGHFQQRLDERGITHWWTYPRSPK